MEMRNENRKMRIAIDGTASSGKGTLAKHLAARLSYPHFDTGALYRAVAYVAHQNDVDWNDGEALGTMTEDLKLRFVPENGKQRLFWGIIDISRHIRSDIISKGASIVSVHAPVRQALLALQKKLAQNPDVVMDGRDIATVIMPDADLKIFVDAELEIRAKRRWEQYQKKGIDSSYEEVLTALRKRDQQDMTREIAPLKQAEDAMLLDTSHLSIEESVAKMMEWVATRNQ